MSRSLFDLVIKVLMDRPQWRCTQQHMTAAIVALKELDLALKANQQQYLSLGTVSHKDNSFFLVAS